MKQTMIVILVAGMAVTARAQSHPMRDRIVAVRQSIEEFYAVDNKDGTTLDRDSTTTGPSGKGSSSEATWSKDGNTVTRDGSATGLKGNSVSSHDTWTKDGKTISHTGSTSYRDDLDTFGSHAKPAQAGRKR